MRKLSSFPKSFLSLTLVLAILLTATAPALGAETVSDAASAIQLMKTEGSVSITNGSGRALSVRENMRLYNGYHAKTTEKSYAWVNLDSSKLIKLDEVSEAEVRKAGKKLEVLLNSGNLYFDVSEPLDQEESLNIRTSTMIVGIRGTCGWVKMLNAWHAQVYLLEGRVECSVTDPATGESRTTVLQGGEMAEFVVYPQGQTGERCDIIRQSYAEEHIDGFVLVELVKDRALCEKIYADSSLDVLGHFDQSSAQKQLERGQAAMAETLREMEQALSTQDNRVSQDPVWDSGSKDSGGSRDNSSSDSGSSSTPSGGDSGVTPEPATVTLTMPVTDMDVQQALNRPATRRVVVAPGTNAAQNTLEIGIDMTVDSGKTLTLDSGVPARVQGSLTVNGTADLGDSLTNDGTITVNSANTLRVAGRFVNSAGGTITNTASGRITVGLGLSNAGSLSTAGRIEGPVSLTGGSFTITGGEVTSDQTATLSVSSGAALALTGGAVTNTGSGTAVTLAAGLSFPANFATDFRAKTAVVASPSPSGCGAALQSDGYYHLTQSETVGPFSVIGGTDGIDYSYGYGPSGGSGTLTVHRDTPLTISMAEGIDYTTDKIVIDDGVSANITLAGVNISATEHNTTPFSIADNSTGDVTITLAAGTQNNLEAGQYAAAIQKNNLANAGSLTITGSGSLITSGGAGGTSIGGSTAASIGTVVVSGGEIVVIWGITASDFTMSGGSINGSIRTSDFTMSGGKIDGNVLGVDKSFTITSGEIKSSTGNTVTTASGVTLNLTGGTITCDANNGSALSMGQVSEFPSTCNTVIRGKDFAMQSLPDGYVNSQHADDGYYYLEPGSIAGAFAVTGGTAGTDYEIESVTEGSKTLKILTSTPLTIQNTDPSTSTTDSIFVEDGVSANLTLAGVKIDLSATGEYSSGGGTGTPGVPAFQIADNSSGNVSLTLGAGTENTLLSGAGRAGLEKNSEESSGRLTIKGTGKLTATGGDIYMNATPDISHSGAGIGACGFANNGNSICANITIESGEISASSSSSYAPGIGDEIGAVGIQIAGGTVTVPGTFGILSADITISGGTVNGDISTSSFDMSAGTVNGKVVNVSDSFTISGGEIVSNASIAYTVVVDQTSTVHLDGGTITNNCTSQDSGNYGAICIAESPLVIEGEIKTDIRGKKDDLMVLYRLSPDIQYGPYIPDGYAVSTLQSDGYYHLVLWKTVEIKSAEATAETIQAALNSYDEVYITNDQDDLVDVTFASDLTIPAGKVLSLSGIVNLTVSDSANLVNNGTINLNNRSLTVNGTLTNSGTISDCYNLALTASGSKLVMLDGDIFGWGSTTWMITVANSPNLILTGGTITYMSDFGYLIGPLFETDTILPDNLGTENATVFRSLGGLLGNDMGDMTEAMGYQSVQKEDGYYHLVKKEENP
jgi:hypothetical protein